MRLIYNILAIVLLSTIAGCDNRGESKSDLPPPPATIEHAGTISGRVTFAGVPPRLPRLPVQGDSHCVRNHPDGLPDEAIVVADDGAIANVFVYMQGGPRWDGSAREPAVLDQAGCQYHPHAVGIQLNQPLHVRNSDPVFHNVHMIAERNPGSNLSSMPNSDQVVQFRSPEFIPARCDVHPWMKSIVGVFENAYFAVTGPDGRFSLSNVPPGSYTLAAWHERFGELTKKITVAPDGTVREDLVYK